MKTERICIMMQMWGTFNDSVVYRTHCALVFCSSAIPRPPLPSPVRGLRIAYLLHSQSRALRHLIWLSLQLGIRVGTNKDVKEAHLRRS